MSLEEIEASLIRQETTEYLRDLTLDCFWRRRRPSPVWRSSQTSRLVQLECESIQTSNGHVERIRGTSLCGRGVPCRLHRSETIGAPAGRWPNRCPACP